MFTQKSNNLFASKTKKVEHAVSVHHPGKGDDNIEDVILVEMQNKKGVSTGYYMDVKSVICLEEVCKVVSVRLYWNNLGEYQKYKLEKGVTLEKYEADFFDKKDYKQLHKILATEDSPFKNVRVDEILTVVDDAHLEDVDAVSGATALELEDDETVHGAALTCYTLWHWANGEIKERIKDFTGKSFSEENFIAYLTKKDSKYQLFALEQLTKRIFFSNKITDVVIWQTTRNIELLKTSIKYLEASDKQNYYQAIEKLFLQGNKEQKIASLNSLLKTKLVAPENFFDDFSKHTSKLKSYQEVSTFLRLMKNKNPNSSIVVNQVFPLLERELLIARSAYWFLKNNTLNTKQKEILSNFYNEHKAQL